MKPLLALVLLLAWAPGVLAQSIDGPIRRAVATAFSPGQVPSRDVEKQRLEAERVARAEQDRARLNLATWVFLGTAGADWAVTAACLKVRCSDDTGHSTSYFVVNGFKNEGTAVALGLGLDTAIVLFVREVIAPDHPKIAQGLLYGLSGVRIVITTNKVSDLRGHAVRQP